MAFSMQELEEQLVEQIFLQDPDYKMDVRRNLEITKAMVNMNKSTKSVGRASLFWGVWGNHATKDVLDRIEQKGYIGFNRAQVIVSIMKISQHPVLQSRDADLAFLMRLFHQWGANVEKLTEPSARMRAEDTKLVEKFVAKYNLKSNGGDLGPSDITLPRIALVFPLQSCTFSKRDRAYAHVKLDVPDFIKTPAFSCFIPRQPVGRFTKEMIDKLLTAHIDCVTVLLTNIIDYLNVPSCKKTVEERKKEARAFAELAMSSELYTDEERITHLVLLDVIEEGVLANKIRNYKSQ